MERSARHVRKVEEHAAQLLVSVQKHHEHQAMTTADVHERADARKIVRLGDGSGLHRADGRHGGVEDRRRFQRLREVLEHRHAEDAIECRFARADAVTKLPPWTPCALVRDESGVRAERLRRVGAKQLPQRHQTKLPVCEFGEQPEARQRTEQSVHAVFGRARRTGDVGRGLRAVLQQIGNSEVGRDGERLTDPFSGSQVHEGHCVGGVVPAFRSFPFRHRPRPQFVLDRILSITETLCILGRLTRIRQYSKRKGIFFRLTFFRRERSVSRRFGRVEISAGQVRRFPVHRHLNPGAAARVIEENKFFKWTRIEFSISAQL